MWVHGRRVAPDLPRGPFAREVGIKAGLAVPVLAQGDVVAVLEFFMAEAHEQDRAMIGLVTAAAAQLGALVLRRQAEDAVQASEECFRLLVESVEDYAIFMLDPNGEVASWNPGAQRITGYRADEIVGYHVSRFYPPECRPRRAGPSSTSSRRGRTALRGVGLAHAGGRARASGRAS